MTSCLDSVACLTHIHVSGCWLASPPALLFRSLQTARLCSCSNNVIGIYACVKCALACALLKVPKYPTNTCVLLMQHIKLLGVDGLHGFTVRVDNVKSVICPTNSHINYSKIVEILKTFKTTIISPTCFGLHKPSSGSSQSVLRRSYNIDFGVYTSLTFRHRASSI